VNLRIRRAAATAAVVLALSAALAGCGVGFDAPTTQVSPPHPSGDIGPMRVRSFMLIQREGGGPAAAVVTLVNTSNEPQALRSLQITPPQTGGGAATATPSTPLDVAAAITVPAHGAVHVGAQGQPTVTVNGLDAIARPGQLALVTLIFDKAGRMTLNVVVQAGTGPFASFAPTAQPTLTTSISPATTTSPSGTESPTSPS
jgi:copper(I)-binding protein